MISDSKNVRLIALSVSKQKSTNESKAPQVAGQEPFVAGADTMIDRVVADIPDAERGFTMIFSAMPFPGYQYQLDWRREEVVAIGITRRPWVRRGGCVQPYSGIFQRRQSRFTCRQRRGAD